MGRIRDDASVVVSEAVNGLPQRVGRGPGRRPNTSRVQHVVVDAAVWALVLARLRPGERAVVVDAHTARTVYR